jgi:hypothetical protein
MSNSFSELARHHIVNTTAIVVPVTSWLIDVQPALTAILTLMGIVWYAILYFKEWRNRK